MIEEFIPYEQALVLKELGFDEPCMAQWNDSNGFDGVGGNYRNSYFTYPDQITAPIYQQAFRWFRKKYKLQHHIWSGKLNHIFYGYDILNIEKQKRVVNNSDIGGGDCDYDTYEEAELACLKKLIELVKQKNDGTQTEKRKNPES